MLRILDSDNFDVKKQLEVLIEEKLEFKQNF
jgi:hypothetical protein